MKCNYVFKIHILYFYTILKLYLELNANLFKLTETDFRSVLSFDTKPKIKYHIFLPTFPATVSGMASSVQITANHSELLLCF